MGPIALALNLIFKLVVLFMILYFMVVGIVLAVQMI